MHDAHRIELTVNGRSVTAEVDARTSLVQLLRDQLSLTGTHVGCEHGSCGACTVHVDGSTARGCLVLAVQADGADVLTIEGVSAPGEPLGAVQQAFTHHHALQCGFCTPGFVMSVLEYLDETPCATDLARRRRLSGNWCRCTGYQGVVAAVRQLDAERHI